MTIGMEGRALKDDEMATMARLLDEGLAAGALGLPSGLFTAPGSSARPDEIHALLGVVRRYGESTRPTGGAKPVRFSPPSMRPWRPRGRRASMSTSPISSSPAFDIPLGAAAALR
jgi:N-acyl-D-aspartate/D-glutamate deacylase